MGNKIGARGSARRPAVSGAGGENKQNTRVRRPRGGGGEKTRERPSTLTHTHTHVQNIGNIRNVCVYTCIISVCCVYKYIYYVQQDAVS